jgi:hypothetical protein
LQSQSFWPSAAPGIPSASAEIERVHAHVEQAGDGPGRELRAALKRPCGRSQRGLDHGDSFVARLAHHDDKQSAKNARMTNAKSIPAFFVDLDLASFG